MHPQPYIGRFAPTPSGHLHFGSLLAALASYLDARSHAGSWLLRVEDLDQPRCVPGATDHILRTLEAYGMVWDGEVIRQNQRVALYQQVIDNWLDSGLAYYCDCSRQHIAKHGGVYPGTCRNRHLPFAHTHAVRVQAPQHEICFTDRLQGYFGQRLAAEVGDFVVKRRDGVIAYQLAVVIDDIAQGVTDIVRGADLIDSTPRQLWLYQLLKSEPPRYLHIPLVMRQQGEKLSKRLASPPIDTSMAPATLFKAIAALAQEPPADLRNAPVGEQLAWASNNWSPERLPAALQLLESTLPQA
ncbi:MAG TPA: tRNA glutamyl-Q(34) synthetase GluQRS [Pseudomonas xinjiangensis]|uniref:Glutamyl-Q tRNA(Asp) synthetase n=2 Tax=root TaxID=1 RepID=A0A7V1FRR2_9GAMM|nr:tRNA glutamyl-Q(34) synthetase GluQRS [Halopseudomonas xinjiangensis]HEC46459.1 tRNA glutamyl-Q(34) synthetase GluQRS [Halopseudomonas xinjiangensis]